MGSVLAPGDIVAEKYRIDGLLGTGGNGAVFRAMHLVLDRPVAIKVLHPQIATETGSARFLREARTLGRLKSDHVAEVFDVGELPDGALYLVMELLEGIELGALLVERGALPVPEAVTYVLDVCRALGEAHAAGIVHRDLKPSNLFLVPNPGGRARIKVLDFGIAKVLPEHTLTEAGEIMGTPAYMAPEQLGLGGSIDARTDIWALGVILFELVTGQRPFAVQSLVSAIAQIMATPPTGPTLPRAAMPPALEAIILRCLSASADRRFASVAELAAALAPFAAEQPFQTHAALPALALPARPAPSKVLAAVGGDPQARLRPVVSPIAYVAGAALFVLVTIAWVIGRHASSPASAVVPPAISSVAPDETAPPEAAAARTTASTAAIVVTTAPVPAAVSRPPRVAPPPQGPRSRIAPTAATATAPPVPPPVSEPPGIPSFRR